MSWLQNSWKKFAAVVAAPVVLLIAQHMEASHSQLEVVGGAFVAYLLAQGWHDAGKTQALVQQGLAAAPGWLKGLYAAAAGVVPLVTPGLHLDPTWSLIVAGVFGGGAIAQGMADHGTAAEAINPAKTVTVVTPLPPAPDAAAAVAAVSTPVAKP